MHQDIQEIVYSEEQITKRVAELGAEITRDFADKASDGIVLICVLRGAAIFMADLARKIELPLEMDYMVVSSYGKDVKSSGVVKVIKDLDSEIEGKHVIIAEDILDSGLTLSRLQIMLASRNPASLTTVALLRKDTPNQADVGCKYTGFVVPDVFIVGYGLDYAERYRNLNYIGVLKPEVYGG